MSNLLAKIPKDLPEQIVRAALPKLKTFWYYAKVELTPPKISDIPEIKNGISKIICSYKTGAWKQLTVKQGTLNTLVAMECVFWFYIGEVIGKRHLIGYKLP